jgi:hypothetical protein
MFYYTVTGISLIFNALPGILLIWIRPEYVFWYNSLFVAPSILFSYLFMKMWNIQTFTFRVLALKQVTYWAHVIALKDKLFNTLVEWVPTGASGAIKQNKDRFNTARLLCGIYNTALTSALITGATWQILAGWPWWNFLPTLVIMALNLYLVAWFLIG